LIFNSFGMAQRSLSGFAGLSLLPAGRLSVIVSCLPTLGTHASSIERIDCGQILADCLLNWGLSCDYLLFDPIWLPAHCGEEALRVTLDTAAGLRERFREARVLGVTSNYSFGAEDRYACEAKVAACAGNAGCDAFLCNPFNTALMNVLRESQ
jgi:cobalamin-dependent methionine synthase I